MNKNKTYETKCRKCGNQFLWISGLTDGVAIKSDETIEIYHKFIDTILVNPPIMGCRICGIRTVQDLIAY